MNIIKLNINKKKIIKISIAICITILAFILLNIYNISFASGEQTTNGSTNNDSLQVINKLEGIVGVIPTIFLTVIKIVLIVVLTSISWIIGFTVSGKGMLTLDSILFNDLPLINLDFNPANAGEYTSFMVMVAASVKVLMYIAIVLQLMILLFTIIKYMTRSIADDKASAKIILINWAKGIAIMFGVIFFMFLMIAINNALVGAIRAGLTAGQHPLSQGITMEILKNAIMNSGFRRNCINICIYCYFSTNSIFLFLLC